MAKITSIASAFLLIALTTSECRKAEVTGNPAPNLPPSTRLANIPAENDSSHAYPFRLTFSWDGGDEDGSVVGFRYQWNDNDWKYTTARSSTFAFESPNAVNRQIFRIKAVDNEDAEDPTPESRIFYTVQNGPPETVIVFGPADSLSVFVLPSVTDSWKGIEYRFSGSDLDGAVVAFEYAVDDTTAWIATYDNIVRLAGVAAGWHTFYVRSVDDAEGVDKTPAQRQFRAIVPSLDQGILVIDETRDGTGVKGSPSDAEVDNFYRRVFSANQKAFAEWDYATQGSPTADDIASYSLILWQGDDRAQQVIRSSRDLLEDYLSIGGKLWIIGWRLLPELDSFLGATQHSYVPSDFGFTFLHLQSYSEQTSYDFVGANGVAGYAGIEVDSVKLPTSFGGKLNFIGTMLSSDARPILTFRSSINSSFQGEPCGAIYTGSTYKVAAFSFPLYFMNEQQSAAVVGKLLIDLGE